jgi:acyl-phosphate glycerol 3-phosphate acyltransferase
MTPFVVASFTILTAYLVGAVPFGYLIARLRGVDILQQGSGNIGATNVGRVLGRRFGLLVFGLDFAKGALPAALAGHLPHPSSLMPSWDGEALPVLAGLAAFVGHMYPVYLRFHGGKGVATGTGVVAVLLPGPALGALLVWLGVFCATRYVSVASMTAATTLCFFRLTWTEQPFDPGHRILTLFCFLAMCLVVLRHRANIARLLHGSENRIEESSAVQVLCKTVHVLALGLWFGTVIFFLIATLTIFHTFEALGSRTAERASWMPLPAVFDKEKGTQLAGIAVAPLFDWYFPLQGMCGFLAVATALPWSRRGPRIHRFRSGVLLLAWISVLVGWPLARYVAQLRVERYAADSALAASARAAFGTWHTYSLLFNFVALILVAIAMALAAQMPPTSERGSSAPR